MTKKLILAAILLSLFALIRPQEVIASKETCEAEGVVLNSSIPEFIDHGSRTSLEISLSALTPGNHSLRIHNDGKDKAEFTRKDFTVPSTGTATAILTSSSAFQLSDESGDDDTKFEIREYGHKGSINDYCVLAHYTVMASDSCGGLSYSNSGINNLGCLTPTSLDTITDIFISNVKSKGVSYTGKVGLKFICDDGSIGLGQYQITNGNGTISLNISSSSTYPPQKCEFAHLSLNIKGKDLCQSPEFKLINYCSPEELVPSATEEATDFDICRDLFENGSDKYEQCNDCLTNKKGIWTALGCIKTDPKAFIGDFLKIAIGIAGGIALLLMIYGAFLVSVSAGDPKKAEEGKEMITGTIAGLLFIIFSVFLLRLIGINILQIPGF